MSKQVIKKKIYTFNGAKVVVDPSDRNKIEISYSDKLWYVGIENKNQLSNMIEAMKEALEDM